MLTKSKGEEEGEAEGKGEWGVVNMAQAYHIPPWNYQRININIKKINVMQLYWICYKRDETEKEFLALIVKTLSNIR